MLAPEPCHRSGRSPDATGECPDASGRCKPPLKGRSQLTQAVLPRSHRVVRDASGRRGCDRHAWRTLDHFPVVCNTSQGCAGLLRIIVTGLGLGDGWADYGVPGTHDRHGVGEHRRSRDSPDFANRRRAARGDSAVLVAVESRSAARTRGAAAFSLQHRCPCVAVEHRPHPSRLPEGVRRGGVAWGPHARPANRPAHQIRQRQARRSRPGVPLCTLRLAGANLLTQTVRPALTAGPGEQRQKGPAAERELTRDSRSASMDAEAPIRGCTKGRKREDERELNEGSAGWIAAMLLITKTEVAADLSDDVIPERIRRLLNPSP